MGQKKVFEKPTMKYVPYKECIFLAASNETIVKIDDDFWTLEEAGGGD